VQSRRFFADKANGMKKPRPQRTPLKADEREGIVLAVNSAFRKLKNLYTRIVPIFEDFRFTPPSGVIARDLSENIEKAIIQHCDSFTKGDGHCDLCGFDQDWEVKICKDSGLTINQSKVINCENYIVVNYKANSIVKSIWILWNAEDRFFSPRLKNSKCTIAQPRIRSREHRSDSRSSRGRIAVNLEKRRYL
jgi:hypothetical protein